MGTWKAKWGWDLKEGEKSKFGLGTAESEASSGSSTLSGAQKPRESEHLHYDIENQLTSLVKARLPLQSLHLFFTNDFHCQGAIYTKKKGELWWALPSWSLSHTFASEMMELQSLKSKRHIAQSLLLPVFQTNWQQLRFD